MRAVAICCVCLAALPATAAAEKHYTPMVGLTFRGNTSIVDNEQASGNTHPSLGGAVMILGGGIFGVEGITSLTPGFFTADNTFVTTSRTFTLMGNGVLTAPRRLTEYSLRPYVSGGVGLLRVSKDEGEKGFTLQRNFAGLNIGGGAVGFLTAHTGLRFDFRYYSLLHGYDLGAQARENPAHLRYMTLSVGVVLRR